MPRVRPWKIETSESLGEVERRGRESPNCIHLQPCAKARFSIERQRAYAEPQLSHKPVDNQKQHKHDREGKESHMSSHREYEAQSLIRSPSNSTAKETRSHGTDPIPHVPQTPTSEARSTTALAASGQSQAHTPQPQAHAPSPGFPPQRPVNCQAAQG